MEVRVKKLKNVSEAGENKFTGEMIKSGSELVQCQKTEVIQLSFCTKVNGRELKARTRGIN